MAQTVAAEPVPLSIGNDQVMRVEGTRVELETIVFAFQSGATPEEIAQDYPALALNDIYAVVTYSLRHREEVGTIGLTWEVAPPGPPQIRTCGFPASGSSWIGFATRRHRLVPTCQARYPLRSR